MAEMERVIPAGMKESLERNRSKLNSIFEYHRSVNREPDYDDILSLFHRMISPVYEKGFVFSDDMLCSIFGTVLDLAAKGYIGKNRRFPDIEEKFFEMLNSFSQLFSTKKSFSVELLNALINLYSKTPDMLNAWCKKIQHLNCGADINDFKDKGIVLAWRYGLARFRNEAVEILNKLQKNELSLIFDSDICRDSEAEEIINSIKNNPWFNPCKSDEVNDPVFLYADGFTGFGGHFKSVPDVFSFEGELFAADGIDLYRIYADSFGVELLHETNLKPDTVSVNGAGMVYGITGAIVLGGKSYKLPEFSSGAIRSSASVGHTSAWTVQSSYKIFIAGISTGNG